MDEKVIGIIGAIVAIIVGLFFFGSSLIDLTMFLFFLPAKGLGEIISSLFGNGLRTFFSTAGIKVFLNTGFWAVLGFLGLKK